MANQYGDRILSAIIDSNSQEPVRFRKPNPIEKEAVVRQELDGVWSLFNAWCIGNNLSPTLVASRPVFTDWYLSLREGTEIAHSPLISGWRNTISRQFAEMIQKNHELTFTYNNNLEARSSLR